jgi:phage recombination protein Bet
MAFTARGTTATTQTQTRSYQTTVKSQTALQTTLDVKPVNFEAHGEQMELSIDIIKKYLVSGDASRVTDQECMMFLQLCSHHHLDPWLREAYLIKFGDNPATIVTGKEAFTKRAEANPAYDGMEAGIVLLNGKGEVEWREGSAVYQQFGETLIGGWAKVHRKDRTHPIYAECALDEYVGRKKDGEVNGQWSSKPGTMIRKVAVVQALREAFPTDLGAMYSPEEMGVDVDAEFREVNDMPQLPPVQKSRQLAHKMISDLPTMDDPLAECDPLGADV